MINLKNMNKIELYKNYISKLEEALKSDNFDFLDTFLEQIYIEISEKDREEIEDIIDEATLYLELKEQDYKDEALNLIEDFKK